MVVTQAIVAREPAQPLQPNWSLEKVDVGPVGDDDVLVEIHAAGICHTDVVLGSVPRGAFGVAYPKVTGHEGAGVVQAFGKNVEGIEVGDPVLLSFASCSVCQQCLASHPAYCNQFAAANYAGNTKSMKMAETDEPIWAQFFGQSSFAHHSVVNKSCLVNAKNLVKELGELKLFAPLGCGFQTGMGAIENIAKAGPDDIVMISGLGAVGMGALLTAKIAGCKSIIAIDRVKSRLDLAVRLGASHTIDTSDPSYTRLDDAVKNIVPSGASVAVDTTGVPAIIEEGIQATRARGRVVLIGIPPLGYKMELNVAEHTNKGRAILGCVEGDCIPQQAIPRMIQWYREGKFPIDLFIQYFNVKATDYEQACVDLKKGDLIKPVLVWK